MLLQLAARVAISPANPVLAQANFSARAKESRPAKQFDGLWLLGYFNNVNRNLNLNPLLNAQLLRRVAVGF